MGKLLNVLGRSTSRDLQDVGQLQTAASKSLPEGQNLPTSFRRGRASSTGCEAFGKLPTERDSLTASVSFARNTEQP
ncbi:hypothetical protein EVAR_49478_1 [Eumeta japonica]|uniref:Uncharacterized protein n=1 Tax=Eumeta variegata TaxID=151549 RepID=A0A4C1VWN1_EUMVA|nr:hypothetical protein EVAR_49478_1 [Eumeta japonica]